MSDQPATKADFKRLENSTKGEIKRLEETTKSEFKKFEDRFLTALDKVMGELKAIREELVATFGLYKRHGETLENHEERITQIEKKLTPS